MTEVNTIGVGGLVHQRTPLGLRELAATVTTDHRGVRSIELVDVLAMMRVDAGAELIVATDPTGASLAIPIRQIIGSTVACIEIADAPTGVTVGGRRYSRPVLVVADWTDDRTPFLLESLHAVSFRAFVAGTY